MYRSPGPGILARTIAAEAAARDQDGRFPTHAFDALAAAGLIGRPPLQPEAAGDLLRLLAEIGRGDLNVGRIFEGHVNALLLIRSHGTARQCRQHDGVAHAGGIYGVWNTDLPDDPLRIENDRLVGKKSFASGIDGLSHAVVTVAGEAGRQMLVVPLHAVAVDRSWWRPMGMRASGSHIADFAGIAVRPDWLLGAPDDYLRQPWFSAGAIRFAAVQAGGIHAVFETAVDHLRRTRRSANPYQAHRIGRMAIAVESAYAWLDRAADAWAAAGRRPAAGPEAIAIADATRSAIEAIGLAVLEEAERAVGAAGLVAPHPLERQMRDLRTYLRQPNPDGALEAVGLAVADGTWSPGGRSIP